MNKRISGIFIVMLLLVSVMSVLPAGSHPDIERRIQTVEFSCSDLIFDKRMGYDIVRLKDSDSKYLNEVGKPLLPVKQLQIALPPGMAVNHVYVLDTKMEEMLGAYNIFPAQLPITTADYLHQKCVFVEPDGETYVSIEPYPSTLVELSHQGDLAGQGIAVLELHPLQYIPQERRLILYTSITFAIECVNGYEYGDYLPSCISERGRKTYEKMLQHMVSNSEDVYLLSSSQSHQETEYEYVIITTPSLMDDFQPYADWKTRKGTPATIMSTDEIYSNYNGENNAEKIRNFITDVHDTWGAIWFLLGGDVSQVPIGTKDFTEERQYPIPSDMYYSDFDDDWYCEVFVGRAPVDNPIEVARFIDKMLAYEKNPPMDSQDYPTNAAFFGFEPEAETSKILLEYIDEQFIPPVFDPITKLYEDDMGPGDHKTPVLAAMNEGHHLVVHNGHGRVDGDGINCGIPEYQNWISSAEIDALRNGNKQSILASSACFAGAVDYEDCIMEHFIQNPDGGGVATLSNTREGILIMGVPFTLSHRCILGFYKSLFMENRYHIGEAFADSKNDNPPRENNYYELHVRWTFNLLGDPELSIWTDTADRLCVEHLAQLPLGSTSFKVHVVETGEGGNAYQAFVCLWKDDEIYTTGYTNTTGDITFDVSSLTPGIMHVTVTKQGCLPYKGEVEIKTGTVLSYTPLSHNFGYRCEDETDSTIFEIWNAGTGTLEYTLNESCDWLTIEPTSGSSTGEHDPIDITIDTTGLSLGSYSNNISILSNGGTGIFFVRIIVTDNIPPDKPSNPIGETAGTAGTEYIYTSTTNDSEEDDIAYWFDWGDGTYSGWTDFEPSGTEVSASHIWTWDGIYQVKVKAKDIHDNESKWSDPIEITIEDNIPPTVGIVKPEKALYINNKKILPLPPFIKKPIVLGDIDVKVDIVDNQTGIDEVKVILNGGLILREKKPNSPYHLLMPRNWIEQYFGNNHIITIQVIVYDNVGNSATDEITFWFWDLFW